MAYTVLSHEIASIPVDLEIDESCVYRELYPILDQCLYRYETVSEELRSHVAVLLSICQFQVAKVPLPSQCQDLGLGSTNGAFDSCTGALFSKLQHWTTYDGCYKFVSQGCLQELLRYQSDRIVELHANISGQYSMVFEEMESHFEQYQRFKGAVSDYFSKQVEVMENSALTMERLNKQASDALEHTFKEFDVFFIEKKVELYHFIEIIKMHSEVSLTNLNSTVENVTRTLESSSSILRDSAANATQKLAEMLSAYDAVAQTVLPLIRSVKLVQRTAITGLLGALVCILASRFPLRSMVMLAANFGGFWLGRYGYVLLRAWV